MNQLSPDDEEKIKKKFNELTGKLESLKAAAINNNCIDKVDISGCCTTYSAVIPQNSITLPKFRLKDMLCITCIP